MKQTFLLFLICMLSIATKAHDFMVNDIYYNITSEADKTVAVTFKGSTYNECDDEYSGSVVIPSTVTYKENTYSVTSINQYTFYYCSGVTSVTIPNTVTNIGEYAFLHCVLKTVYNYATTPQPLNSSNDFSFYKYITLYVPYNSIELYSSADYWKDFKEIKAIPGTEPTPKCATPSISLVNGKIHFESETKGVTFHYTITPVASEISSEGSADVEIDTTPTYTITCYATADSYEQSETVTTSITISNADVNCDGVINMVDVTAVVDKVLKEK